MKRLGIILASAMLATLLLAIALMPPATPTALSPAAKQFKAETEAILKKAREPW